ncbi:hypothetical protein ACJX0J_006652 [Zea mays]
MILDAIFINLVEVKIITFVFISCTVYNTALRLRFQGIGQTPRREASIGVMSRYKSMVEQIMRGEQKIETQTGRRVLPRQSYQGLFKTCDNQGGSALARTALEDVHRIQVVLVKGIKGVAKEVRPFAHELISIFTSVEEGYDQNPHVGPCKIIDHGDRKPERGRRRVTPNIPREDLKKEDEREEKQATQEPKKLCKRDKSSQPIVGYIITFQLQQPLYFCYGIAREEFTETMTRES